VNEKTGKPYGYDSKAFQDAYNSFQAENPDKTICSQTEVDLAYVMVNELTKGNRHLSDDINYLLKHGKAEQSHLVEYEGLMFKFRPDLETKKKIVDWKTCGFEVPKAENFSRQIVKFGYHISAAFYQYFDWLESGIWRSFYWVAQEKEPPYDFNIIDASNWTWQIHDISVKNDLILLEEEQQYVIETERQIVVPKAGALLFLKLLMQYIECVKSNTWNGYSIFTPPDWKGRRIAISEVPKYETIKTVTFFN